MDDRWLNTLGLCQRAGKLAGGEEMVLKAVRSGQAHLVIVATDASDNTRKRFTDKCHTYETPVISAGTIETLGNATGKQKRAVCAVLDAGFAKAIRERMDT